jgi:hypothetical protein
MSSVSDDDSDDVFKDVLEKKDEWILLYGMVLGFGLVWLIIMEMEECVVCVECALHSNRMLCNTRYSNDMITS